LERKSEQASSVLEVEGAECANNTPTKGTKMASKVHIRKNGDWDSIHLESIFLYFGSRYQVSNSGVTA
jgi:hypothetical protein